MVAHIQLCFYAHISILGPYSKEFFALPEYPLTGNFLAGIIISTILRDERGEAVA